MPPPVIPQPPEIDRRLDRQPATALSQRGEHVIRDYLHEHPEKELSRLVHEKVIPIDQAFRVLIDQARDPKTNVLRPDILEYVLRYQMYLRRDLNRTFSVLMVDLDHFKQINEELTHVGADEVLVKAAHTIIRSIRDLDRVVESAEEPEGDETTTRWGGEEFIVVLDNADQTQARLAAERIRENIQTELVGLRPNDQPITISGSVVEYDPDRHGDWRALLREASSQTLAAKQAGRNRIFPEVETQAA